jgi:hypothetical protein
MGALTPKLEKVVHTLEWVRMEEFIASTWQGCGRPEHDRRMVANALVSRAILVPRHISFALFEPPRIAGRFVANPRHRTSMAVVRFARAARAQLRKSGSRYVRKLMGRGTSV